MDHIQWLEKQENNRLTREDLKFILDLLIENEWEYHTYYNDHYICPTCRAKGEYGIVKHELDCQLHKVIQKIKKSVE